MRCVVACVVLMAAVSCAGQSEPSDSQTLRAILSEIRAVHDELRVTQTTQILLTELEIQQSVVNRATQRADDAQSKLREAKAAETDNAARQKQYKDQLDETTDQNETKELTYRIEQLKSEAAALATMDQERTSAVQAAQQQLREAQDALDDIQNQLSQIVKRLNPPRE